MSGRNPFGPLIWLYGTVFALFGGAATGLLLWFTGHYH